MHLTLKLLVLSVSLFSWVSPFIELTFELRFYSKKTPQKGKGVFLVGKKIYSLKLSRAPPIKPITIGENLEAGPKKDVKFTPA